MSDEELIGALDDRWQEHFADGMARRVCEAGAVGVLYRIAAGLPGEDKDSGESGGTGKTGLSRGIGALPNPVRHKIRFRAAYVLERLYFTAPEHFMPHAETFCRRDFPACGDPSARRHFAKIMADLLRRIHPDSDVLDGVAGAAAEWAVDPAAKVAVRVWAVEVLKRCRGRVAWVDEIWDDLLAAQALTASPGIESRLRRSWR